MPAKTPWTVDAYATEKGESPAWSFMKSLQGRDKAEAIALVKLLEEQGNALRRPRSGTPGQGLFVPPATLRRVRQYQALVMKRQPAIVSREKKR